jgi:hypothetical protein
MKIIDEISAKFSGMSRDVREIPVLDQLHAAGVKLPANGRFTRESLDMVLMSTKLSIEQRVKLKNEIYAAGMVDEPPRPVDEAAVRHAANLLRKHGIALRSDNTMFTVADIDAAAAERNLSVSDRLHLKRSLEVAGLLDLEGTTVSKPPMSKPAPGVVANICASLDIDPPRAGAKVSLATLNKAMAAKDMPPRRRIEVKAILSAAGVLAE